MESLKQAVEVKRKKHDELDLHVEETSVSQSGDQSLPSNCIMNAGGTCSSSLLAAHVPNSIKQNIWANEFVEFNTLLKKESGERKQKTQIVNGEVLVSPINEAPKVFERIEPWSDALIIFMSIQQNTPKRYKVCYNIFIT